MTCWGLLWGECGVCEQFVARLKDEVEMME